MNVNCEEMRESSWQEAAKMSQGIYPKRQYEMII